MKKEKFCCKCSQTKDIGQFAFRSRAKGTRQSYCKVCHRADDKRRYHVGPRKEQVRRLNKQYRERNFKFVRRVKKQKGCSVCGYRKHHAALDFHHVKDRKAGDRLIANLCSNANSLERIKEEVRKCVVLCANCHRVEHAGVD